MWLRKLSPIVVMLMVSMISSCATIFVPLPGTTILRRAGLSEVGARISVGAITTPSVEGTIDPLLDSEGRVINPIPGEKNAIGDKTVGVTGMAQVELAVDWGKKYEFGFSSTRGIFGMWDYAVWDNAALTLTPSYSTSTAEGGDPKFETTTDENGNEVNVINYGFKGKASNVNVTQLASLWIGNLKWASMYLYGGVGVNSFQASIKQKESGVEEKSSQVAPSVLGGIHVRLLIFELTAESGATRIKYRDGSSKTVPTSGASLALHIAL